MEAHSCRVTICDMDGVAHTGEVTAATLFEAVALGLKQLQGNDWVEGIGRATDAVTVSVNSIPVKHRPLVSESRACNSSGVKLASLGSRYAA